MIVGYRSKGVTPVALATDTVYMNRIAAPSIPLTAAKVSAYIDGQGTGHGEQALQAVLYDADHALVAASNYVVIEEGAEPAWVDFLFTDGILRAGVPLTPGAAYDLGVFAGGSSESAQIYMSGGVGLHSSHSATFADGPEPTITGPTNSAGSYSLFLTGFMPYVPPVTLTEEQIGAFAFGTAQAAFGSNVAADRHLARYATVGWYSTALDPDIGSFALVNPDGPCADLVGERVRVVGPDRRSVIAYVKNFTDSTEDLLLTRRLYLAVGSLADEDLRAHVEVLV